MLRVCRWRAVLSLAILLIAAGSATRSLRGQSVSPGEGTAIINKVDRRYNTLRSLRCDFVEHFTGLGSDRTERGTLFLQKPGMMRWAYAEPAGKIFVLDGKFAWAYAPGDAQVQRIAAKQVDDLRSPLRFLLGRTKLQRELDGGAVRSLGEQFEISGGVKGMEQRVSRVLLLVSREGAIESIEVDERDGSTTSFRFTAQVEDVPFSAGTFTYRPPDGVPVVNGLPPL